MANPLGAVAAFCFVICIFASAAHLVFAVPLPELELSEKEWRRVRRAAVLLFTANYAFVVFAWRVLHFS